MPELTIEAVGLIVLSTIPSSGSAVDLRLSTDPATYKRKWPRRQSIRKGIDSTTKQEFGRKAKDMELHFESGATQFLDKATARTLDEWAGRKGARFRFRDGEGNDYTVTIEAFDTDQAYGYKDLYVYTLDLHVWAIALRLGNSYTGD